jgi:alpha-L-rhamnosidase
LVYVPAKNAESVNESGKPAAQSEGVRFVGMENGCAVFEVVSGTYRFTAPLPK